MLAFAQHTVGPARDEPISNIEHPGQRDLQPAARFILEVAEPNATVQCV